MELSSLMKELRRAVHAHRTLHGSVVSDARSLFAAMDVDGSGTLSPVEMKDALLRLDLTQYGWSVSDSELEELIGELDTNKNGLIEWGEFLRASGLEDHGHTAAEAAVRAEQARLKAALEASGGGQERPDLVPTTRKARRALFDRMDANGNGVLSLAEIDKAVIECYPAFNHKPSLMAAYKAADINHDGWIGRREFGRFLRSLVYFNKLWHKFEVMDVDGDRRLELHEFVAGCRHVGVNISDEQAAEEFWQIAEAHGHVLFGEFCAWAGRWHLSLDDEDDDDVDESSGDTQANSSVQAPSAGGPYYRGVSHETDQFPLHTAAQKGNESAVNRLVSSGAVQVDATNEQGTTALLQATGGGHLACVRALLGLGADVNRADHTGCSALQIATLVGKEDIVALLLDAGANMNQADNAGHSALTIAQSGEHLRVLSMLESAAVDEYLQAGGSNEAAQAERQLAMELSAAELAKMETDVARSQADRARNAVHTQPVENGPFAKEGLQSVQYMAAQVQAERTGLAKELIQVQAAKSRAAASSQDPMLAEKDGGPSDAVLLTQLAELDAELARRAESSVRNVDEAVDAQAEHARLLVKEVNEAHRLVAKRADADEAEAELTERDQMHTAAASGREEDLMHLINGGAHVDIRDAYLRTPLQIAAMYGHTHCVERLLENKADPNNIDFLSSADHEGCTALAQAAMNGRDRTVKKLLEYQADIELADFYGCTPLHLASQHGRDTVVKLLLENGAKVNARDNRCWTALHRAAATGEFKVVEHLVAHSVDQSVTDDEGKTALDRAKEHGHDDVLILLGQVENHGSMQAIVAPVGTDQQAIPNMVSSPTKEAETLTAEPEIPVNESETDVSAYVPVPAGTPESRNDIAQELIRMRELQLERMAAERQSIREEKAELQRLKENARAETEQIIAQQKVAEQARADAELAAADAAAQAVAANQQADKAAAAPLANMPHSFGHSDAVARGRQDAAALAVDYAAHRQEAVDASKARRSDKGHGEMQMWGDYSQDGLFGILAAPEGIDTELNAGTSRVAEAGTHEASAAAAPHPGDGDDWAEGPYGYRWELSDVGRALVMSGLEGLSSSTQPKQNHQVLPEHLRPPARVTAAVGGGSPKKVGVLERSLAFSAEELSQFEDPTAKALEAAGVPQERAKDAAATATATVAATEHREKAWQDAETAAIEEQNRLAAQAEQLQQRPVPPPRPSSSQGSAQRQPDDGGAVTTKATKRKKKPSKFLAGPAADFEPYDPREKFGPLKEPKSNMSLEALERVRRGDIRRPRPFSFEERETERRRNGPTKLTVGAAMAAEKAAKEEAHIMKANNFRAKGVPEYLKKSVNITNAPAMPMSVHVEMYYEGEGTLGVYFGDHYPYVKKIHADSPADAVPGLKAYCKLLSIKYGTGADECVQTDDLSYEDAKLLLRMRPVKLTFRKFKEDEEQQKKLAFRHQARLQVKTRAEEMQSSKMPKPSEIVEWTYEDKKALGIVFGDHYPYVKKISIGSPADAVPGLTSDCKLLSIEHGAGSSKMRVPIDGLSPEKARALLQMRPLKLRFSKAGWHAKPVPRACNLGSVGKLDKMAQEDEERKRKNREKAEAKFREAQAPNLSPTKAKRTAKLRESSERRRVAAAEGQNKENPFEQRWADWLQSEGLQSDGGLHRPEPLLSLRQLQRACRKVAGLPPLSGADMDNALRKMKVDDFASPSNPDVGCITAEQAKKWVRKQQHIMCWSRVQSSTAGLPLASATKVLADIIADEQRLPETRWPNLGPRHKVPRAQFVEDNPKIVFETTNETHHRQVLQMSDAEQMELAKAQAALTVKLMQEQQQEAGAAAAGQAWYHETQEGFSKPPSQTSEADDARDTEIGEANILASPDGSEHQGEEDKEVPKTDSDPLYVQAAELVTKQERTEDWALANADPRAVTWTDLAEAERTGEGGNAAGTTAVGTTAAAPSQLLAPEARSTQTSTSQSSAQRSQRVNAIPTPGEKYLERKNGLDVQKAELLQLEAQRARKRAARAQRKNELLRLAAGQFDMK